MFTWNMVPCPMARARRCTRVFFKTSYCKHTTSPTIPLKYQERSADVPVCFHGYRQIEHAPLFDPRRHIDWVLAMRVICTINDTFKKQYSAMFVITTVTCIWYFILFYGTVHNCPNYNIWRLSFDDVMTKWTFMWKFKFWLKVALLLWKFVAWFFDVFKCMQHEEIYF